MRRVLQQFRSGDKGQDLIEYTLLLAFVCLVAAAVFIGAGTATSGIWATANTHLTNANTSAAASSGGS